MGWARRLAAHPVIADALAAGELSASWARVICGWTDRLPEDKRDDADSILVAAARGGVELADLTGLAEEMYQRTASPDSEDDDGFEDRFLDLGLTFGPRGLCLAALAPGHQSSSSFGQPLSSVRMPSLRTR